MTKSKALIFDLDDTLISTIKTVWAKYKYIGREYYNFEIKDEDIKPHWGKPLDDVVNEVLRNTEPLEKMRAITLKESENFPIPAFPETPELIDNLSKKYFLGAVTSSARDFILPDLEKAGFDLNNFKFIQTADDTSFHKPNPKVFDPVVEILDENGIKKEEVVYIGDSLSDFLAARDTGFNFIGVLTGLTTKEEFIENGVKEERLFDIVTDIEEIL